MRQTIIDILKANNPTIDIFSSRVEACQDSALSVQLESSSSEKQGATIYYTTDFVSVVIKVVKSDGYDELLDAQVLWVKQSLLTNPLFFNAQNITNIKTTYAYGQSGETNSAVATVTFGVVYPQIFEPVLPNSLNTMDVGIDFIAPIAQPNLFTSNPQDYLKKPDGVIDFTLHETGLSV